MPETPQGVPESIMLKGFTGIRNTVAREDLSSRELAGAVNVDLDDVGEPHRRRGRKQVVTGNCHSLWTADDGVVYGVKDGELGIVGPDYSFTVLLNGIGDLSDVGPAGVAFEHLGEYVYFTCATGSGIITHATGAVNNWGPAQDIWLSPIVDTSSTLPAIRGKLLGAPPLATALVYYNGRIYLAAGKMLWATEFQAYNFVDKNRGFIQFEADITMLGVVLDGVYVGTTEGVYFLAGGSFETLKRQRVMDSGVIPGSAVEIPGELGNPKQQGENQEPMQVRVAFMTTRGFCVGDDGGKCTNITEATVFFPVATTAAAMFRRQDGMNHYVVCLTSDGAPVNGARTGKYVDPGIIRGNAMWVDLADTAQATEQFS